MLRKITFGLFFLFTSASLSLSASTTATSTVTYTIASIDCITTSGNPSQLNISTATAGSDPTDASDSSCTYAVTTNNTSRNITAALTSAMPSGVTLSVNLTAPTGSTSNGLTALSTTNTTLVTGISNIAQASLSMIYNLAATVAAAQIAEPSSNTVTYTIGP